MHDNSQKHLGQTPLILFATPPPLELLQALTIHIPGSTQNVARFQPQVIKCREFIFTEPDVIGTPSVDINDHCFHLIGQVQLIKSGKLQARLTRIGLQVSRPYEVSTQLYQSCLRYTLTARLSPNWNKAGPWLIQGRDFLTTKGCVNAVKMDVSVKHNELFFTLEASAVKLYPLQVTHLDIVGKHLEHFLTHPDSIIEHDRIASDWCYVLPSMKRGRIASISHEIPEDSPFITYRDLKRHWKNTYGYRLPETDDNMNFYQINFGPFGGKLFTYPEVCLRPRELQRVSRVDPKPILRTFVLEVQSKFPTICGAPIKLQSKAKFTVSDLLSCNQAKSNTHPNLTSKMTGARPAVYRSKTEVDRLFTPQPVPSPQVSSFSRITTASSGQKPGSGTVVPTSQNRSENHSQHRVNASGQQRNSTESHGLKSVPQQNNSGANIVSIRQCTGAITPQNVSHVTGQTISRGHVANSGIDRETTPISTCMAPQGSIQQQSTSLFPMNVQKLTSDHSSTPFSSQVPASQQPVARKLFPFFKARKPSVHVPTPTPSQIAPKHVPTFSAQKKISAVTSAVISRPQSKSLSTATNNFNMSSNSLFGANTAESVGAVFNTKGSMPSFQKVAPNFQRVAPSFHKVIPCVAKPAGSVIPGNSSKKLTAKKNVQDGKMDKSKKRAKEGKKAEPGETKRAKKMKKAET